LKVHNEILQLSGASAVEMVWNDAERRTAMLEGSIEADLQYRSLHLGSFTEFGLSLSPQQADVLRDIRRISEQYALHGSSIHPDIAPFHIYGMLQDRGIPVGIENMDRHKERGRSIEEIEYLVASANAPGVIDLQHCYEVAKDCGHSLDEFARGFAHAMLRCGGITHLHVSGEISENGVQVANHVQLTVATNADAILKTLDSVLSIAGNKVPIILEGDPLLQFECLSEGQKLAELETVKRTTFASTSIASEIELIRRVMRTTGR
jgi:hypothetical protein